MKDPYRSLWLFGNRVHLSTFQQHGYWMVSVFLFKWSFSFSVTKAD